MAKPKRLANVMPFYNPQIQDPLPPYSMDLWSSTILPPSQRKRFPSIEAPDSSSQSSLCIHVLCICIIWFQTHLVGAVYSSWLEWLNWIQYPNIVPAKDTLELAFYSVQPSFPFHWNISKLISSNERMFLNKMPCSILVNYRLVSN